MVKENDMNAIKNVNPNTNLTPISLMDEIVDNGYYLVNTTNPFTGECEFYTMLGKEIIHHYLTDMQGLRFYLSRCPIKIEEDNT